MFPGLSTAVRPSIEIALDREQRQAESLLAILRLANFAILSLALWLSDGILLQHELALPLSGYGALALLGVLLAAIGYYRPWLPWIFVTLETGLIVHCLAMIAVGQGLPVEGALNVPGATAIYLVLVQAAVRQNPALIFYAVFLFAGGWTILYVRSSLPQALDELPLGLLASSLLRDGLPLVVLALVAMTLFAAVRIARGQALRSITEGELRAALARFVPAHLLKRLAAEGEDQSHAESRPVALVIVDIKGFTGLTERLAPSELLALVTGFRELVGQAIERHGGSIDKFMGDSVLAVFGIEAGANPAAAAMACATTIRESEAAWRRDCEARGLPAVRLAIAAHHGAALVAVVGGQGRREFTVLGDPVNVAARMQQICSRLGGGFIASGPLLAAAGLDPSAGPWRRLALRRLRGRQASIDLFVWSEAQP